MQPNSPGNTSARIPLHSPSVLFSGNFYKNGVHPITDAVTSPYMVKVYAIAILVSHSTMDSVYLGSDKPFHNFQKGAR